MHGPVTTPSANGARQHQIAPGLPEDDGSLRFRFHVGDPVYKKLVSTPGLTATIVVDRGTRRIFAVNFHHLRAAT